MPSLGHNIEIRRSRSGWKADALAKACHISRQQLYRIESGACDPSLRTLRRIAAALGVTAGALLDE